MSPSPPPETSTIRFGRDGDPVMCYQQVVGYALGMGFSGRSLWEIAITVSELVTNAIKYAGGGVLTFGPVREPPRGLEVVVEDRGPGIPDIEAAFRDGFSRGRMLEEKEIASWPPVDGIGGGLGAVRRMMDSVQAGNREGGGLRIVACKRLPGTRID
jgi:serine/threonine-protein kinase RsbT